MGIEGSTVPDNFILVVIATGGKSHPHYIAPEVPMATAPACARMYKTVTIQHTVVHTWNPHSSQWWRLSPPDQPRFTTAHFPITTRW